MTVPAGALARVRLRGQAGRPGGRPRARGGDLPAAPGPRAPRPGNSPPGPGSPARRRRPCPGARHQAPHPSAAHPAHTALYPEEKSCSASRCCRGVMKTGSLPRGAGAGRGGLGFCGGPGGGGRGGRCTVVAACRLSSLFTPGPFEAVEEFSCRDPLAGNHRCCCVRVCQSPVLAGVLAGGVPCPLSGGGCRCRRWLRESDV